MTDIINPSNGYKYSAEKLCEKNLPRSAAEYMAKNGLPDLSDCSLLDFVRFYDEEKILSSPSKCGMTVIGELYDLHCIALNDRGLLYIIDGGINSDNDNLDCGLTNSSLEKFVEFLSVYHSAVSENQDALDEGDEKTVKRVYKKLRRKFKAIDRKALKDEESFWSLRLEEISYLC